MTTASLVNSRCDENYSLSREGNYGYHFKSVDECVIACIHDPRCQGVSLDETEWSCTGYAMCAEDSVILSTSIGVFHNFEVYCENGDKLHDFLNIG